MKLTKENVYISLIGKNEDELTELYWLLANNNEVLYRSFQRFLEYPSGRDPYLGFCESSKYWWSGIELGTRKEVTIEELKEILQPMNLTLEQQLQKAEAEVKRLKEAIEDSKIKEGEWCRFWNYNKDEFIIAKFQGKNKFACTSGNYYLNCEKITDSALLKRLNKLV